MVAKKLLCTMAKANADIYNTMTEFCLTDDDLASINMTKQRLREIAYTLLSISENICDEIIDKRTLITDPELMI